MKFINPYTDNYMTYNETTGHYSLTAQAVFERLGIDLSAQNKDNANGVNAILNRISMLTYRKIHEHSNDTQCQDWLIASTRTGREIIYEAMLEQFFYVKNVGDLSLSPKKEERELYFSDTAYEILLREIPEVGRSVCYTGV